MSETQPVVPDAVFYLGADQGIFDGLRSVLAPRGIEIRGFRTIAGMMLAAATCPVRVVVIDPRTLPPERTPECVAERLSQVVDSCPDLLCLATAQESAEQIRDRYPSVADVFAPPYDWARLGERIGALLQRGQAPRWRILIVDADAAEGAMIAGCLEQAGMEAQTVEETAAVVPALERFVPDLLLLDLGLPEGGARAVSERVRDHGSFHDLPLVFLSAHGEPEHPREALRLGGDDYLARPIDPEQLLATLGRRVRRDTPGGCAVPADDEALYIARIHLLQRLDQRIKEPPAPGPGESVLILRIDSAAFAEDALIALRSAILDLARQLAGPTLRGACLSDGDLLMWVRCRNDLAVAALAEEMRAAAQAIALSGASGAARPTLSIGIAGLLPPADDALTLVSRARSACTQASAQGGNRVVLYRPLETVDSSGADAQILLGLIRRALDGQGFQLVYQPILPLRKKRHERYEVLLRLRTPQGDLIPPLTFLPVAARHGLLPAIDRWVLAEGLRVLRVERDARRPTQLMIFQSADSLATPGWLPWVRDEILRLDLIRQRPLLEFNIQDVLQNLAYTAPLFPELSRLGIDICLAGVGDSERVLELLARRPIQLVKLSREMTVEASASRLKWLVEQLHRRGARVIAAGIEDPQAIGRAWSSGADFIQGNFIRFPEESLGFQFEETVLG